MAAVVVLVADRLQIGLGSSIKQGTSTVSVFVQLLASVMVKVCVPPGALVKQKPSCTSWAVKGPAMS